MSWEVWGTPPDQEPARCPECGEESHTDGCELGRMQARAVKAEARVAGLIQCVEDLLAYAQDVLADKQALSGFKPGVVQGHVTRALAAIKKSDT